MRYECDDPDFEGAFVEWSDSWSVRQRRALIDVEGEAYVQLLADKMLSVYLPVVEGEPITEPAQFTQANVDRIDYRLFEWVKRASMQLLLDLASLGEAYRRKLYGTSEEKAAAA